MTNHTPLPWKVREWSEQLITLSNGDIDGIVTIRTADPSQTLDDEDRANAAFIVHAVNAYERDQKIKAELLTALHTAKARLQIAGLGFKDIEKAIAKAEGK